MSEAILAVENVSKRFAGRIALDSVSIENVASSDWAEKVYKPDILARPDTLYKKPGYNPL